MTATERTPRYHYLLAGALLAVLLMQSFFSSLQKSPVYDEPPHIAAGLSYLATGVFRANLQHPPLLKELSALFLNAAGIHWPQSDDAKALTSGAPQGENSEWPIGNSIIASNGPDRVLFWARLPFILLAGFLGVLIYAWGRELVGNTAALGALFFYALDPTIVAHSFLVTTDVGLAAFSMLFFWTVWRYVNQPTRRRLAICGLAMGAMLGAKFSALFMAGSAAVLLLAAIRWPVAGAPTAAPRLGLNSPCPCGSGKKYKRCHGAAGVSAAGGQWRKFMERAGAFLAMCVIAAVFIEALYFFPHDPLLYLEGLQKVNADHVSGYQYYFHGATSTRFYGYFVAAYLLKEPLATLALVGVGVFALLRSKSTPLLTKLLLLFPPAVFLLAMTIFADDMGVRYLIPAMPFAYLLGGIGLATLLASARAWTRYAAIALCLWVAIAAAGIYPDHISYFNETACLFEKPGQIGRDGGSRCGPLWLDDSNVDWGQGLKQLRTWTNRHTDLPPVRLAYPATFPPEGYGLRFEKFLTRQLLTEPAPGWYAVSTSLVGRMPAVGEKFEGGGAAWLRRMTPVEIVGHAFYIYQVK
jgi:hypothetical protein